MAGAEEFNLEDVREELRKFDGGAITLRKNDITGIAYVGIEHEAKKNCFSPKMMVDLSEVIDKLEHWDEGKGLILFSKGDTFSSGSYLKYVQILVDDPATGYKLSWIMHHSFERFRRLSLVTVSVVQGKALGGGGEILMFTDFRLFTPTAVLSFLEAHVGLSLAWGALQPLVDKVGRAKVLDFLLTGREIRLEEAKQLGLVDHIIEESIATPLTDETRVEAAENWLLARINHHPPALVRAQKRMVYSETLLQERTLIGQMWGQPEHVNAIARWSNSKSKIKSKNPQGK